VIATATATNVKDLIEAPFRMPLTGVRAR